MTRPKGTSRTEGGAKPAVRIAPNELPSMRHRRPFMYWTVVVATLAMVLTAFASLISAFA